MIRTQIQLEEEQYRQLRTIGAAETKGLAEQVREAVGLYLAKRRAALPSLDELNLGFQPLPPESANELKPHDRWLADAIIESKRP
jgi:hypothetical protein